MSVRHSQNASRQGVYFVHRQDLTILDSPASRDDPTGRLYNMRGHIWILDLT